MNMEQRLGTVQVSPEVLATLARLTAAAVPGVVAVGRQAPRFLRWLRWGRQVGGVKLSIQPDGVHVALEIVVQQGKNMLEVASRAQHEVSEAIEKMAGLPVREINVRISDVQ
jgi:uncharacterized alkaline shock family protein YloU